MTDDVSKKFNIQIAAQLSGLSAHTIRAWEKRYQALTPSRMTNGRRLYLSSEIDRLIMLSRLTKMGTNISQIAHLSDEELKTSYQKITQTKESPITYIRPKAELDIIETKAKLLSAVGDYKVDIISQLLSEAKMVLPPKVFALDILDTLINEVRVLRDQKLFKDAQAQALFALAKFHAGNVIYSHFEKGLKSNFKIILTSVEKEHHSFPLLISALLCCHHKKHFYYLNSNLPAPSIIDAVKAIEANLLVLSVPINSHSDADIITILDEVINSVSQNVKIWLLGDFDNKEFNTTRWKNIKKIRSHRDLDEALAQNA